MNTQKPLLVAIFLILASLACYSDSPLWLGGELTPPAPTITPLPVPQTDQVNLATNDLALVPEAAVGASFRFDLTTVPEPLAPDLSNKSPQSCSKNSVVRILYSGLDEQGIVYHLVDCSGVAGWTPEFNLLGPITIRVNDRALTTAAGVNESNRYVVELSDPPYEEGGALRQQADCRVNDTVQVVDIKGLASGEIYYKIRCTNPINPVTPNIGWVLSDGLFGPVRFQNGEVGLVPRETETINLTELADEGEVVASCAANELVTITDTPVQRLGDELFYEMTCEAGTGWANQTVLVGPVPYAIGEQVLITAPGVTNSAEVFTTVATAPDTETAPTTLEDEPEALPMANLTANPEPLLLDNAIGACDDATVTMISDLAGIGDAVYAEVTCNDVTGWLDVQRLYGTVEYTLGDTVSLGETALIGFSQRGIFLSIELFDIEGSSGGSSVIAGECVFDFDTNTPIDAQLVDVGYYRSSTGQIVGVFYRAQCQAEDGSTVEGWINQDRIGE